MGPALCRPALYRDKEPIFAFLEDIWGPEDYLQDSWDEWFFAPTGVLAVIQQAGAVAGVGHMADLGQGEYWLEGLRIDPARQGQRFGSQLHDYFIDRWLASDSHALRLLTASSLKSVHRMSERTGLIPVKTLIPFEAEALSGQHGFQRLEAKEAWISTALEGSGNVSPLAGLMDLGWKFAAASPERFEQVLKAALAWEWGGGQAVVVMRKRDRKGEIRAAVQWISGARGALPEALADLRHLAAESDAARVAWLAPADPPYPEILQAAGYRMAWDEPVVLFERLK